MHIIYKQLYNNIIKTLHITWNCNFIKVKCCIMQHFYYKNINYPFSYITKLLYQRILYC